VLSDKCLMCCLNLTNSQFYNSGGIRMYIYLDFKSIFLIMGLWLKPAAVIALLLIPGTLSKEGLRWIQKQLAFKQSQKPKPSL
jgi:hypothetical protein